MEQSETESNMKLARSDETGVNNNDVKFEV